MIDETTGPQFAATADDSAAQDFERALDRVDADPEPPAEPETGPESGFGAGLELDTPADTPADTPVDATQDDAKSSDENANGSGSSRRRGRGRRRKRGSGKSDRKSSDAQSADKSSQADGKKKIKKEMLINALQPEESRIAITENGVLEELYVERNSLESCVANIYKGRVVNIEPSSQAAFVDFGIGRNGFLHVSDVEYQYYKHLLTE